MTRINVGIDPVELPREALLAEHREITRIPNAVAEGRAVLTNPVDKFSLGTGHVRFFYTRMKYLRRRYKAIYRECVHRGYNVTNKSAAFSVHRFPRCCNGDWKPTADDRDLLLERLKERGHTLLKLKRKRDMKI